MPFASEKQRRYMWAKHPDIARRWEHEEKKRSHERDKHKKSQSK